METSRFLSQWESYGMLIFWISLLLILGSAGAALPIAASYTNISATLMTTEGFVIPVLILMVTAMHWSSEREAGRLRLYRTYAVGLPWMVISKYVAFMTAQTLILLIAFGLMGLFVRIPPGEWITLFVYSLLLVAVSAAIGTLLGAVAKNRIRGLMYALTVFVAFVLLWPTILVSTVTHLPYPLQEDAMIGLLLLNPLEMLRIGAMAIVSSNDVFGELYTGLLGWLAEPVGMLCILSVVLTGIFFSLLGTAKLLGGAR